MPSDVPPASPRWKDRLHGHTRRAFDEVRSSASSFRGAAFPPPPEDRRLQRLLFGLLLPFWLLRFWWSDRQRRRSYLRATLPSALVTLALGLLIGLEGSVKEQIKDDAKDARISQLERRIQRNQERIAHARSADQREELEESMADMQSDLAELKAEVAAQVAQELAQARKAEGGDDEEEGSVEAAPAKAAKGPATSPDRATDARKSDEAEGRVDWLPPPPPAPPMPWAPGMPASTATKDSPGTNTRTETPWVRLFAILTAVYGALRVVEWCVLAITRDYQDQLSRKLSLATGTPPDDPEEKPRLRLNLGWLWKKVKRRVRGFLLIGMGLALLSFVKMVPIVGQVVFSVAATVWTFYWLGVFALAKSRLAWEYGEAQTPWFARLSHPALAWWGPRIWGRVSSRISRSIWAACASFERAPFEAVGLAIARLVLNLPVVYSLLRPVYPVAAQHVLVARPPIALALPPETPPDQPTA